MIERGSEAKFDQGGLRRKGCETCGGDTVSTYDDDSSNLSLTSVI